MLQAKVQVTVTVLVGGIVSQVEAVVAQVPGEIEIGFCAEAMTDAEIEIMERSF